MATTIAKLFLEKASKNPNYNVQMAKDKSGKFQITSYGELQRKVWGLSWTLHKLGVKRNDIVGIVSDNRTQWLEADLALLSLGAIDTPRGCDSMDHEIQYILSLTESKLCFVENKTQLNKVLSIINSLPVLKTIIVMDTDKPSLSLEEMEVLEKAYNIKIFVHDKLVENGIKALENDTSIEKFIKSEIEKSEENDTVTIIFTSGTTGTPKGVVLSNKNIMYQIKPIISHAVLRDGMQWISVLPIWHSFERIMTYIAIELSSCIAYSKPVGSIMLKDIAVVRPEIMGSVPRIWEAVKAGVLSSMKKKSPIVRAMFNFFMWIGSKKVKYEDLLHGNVGTFKKPSRLLQIMRAIIPHLLLKIPYAIGDKLVFSQVKEKLGSRFCVGVSGGGSLSLDVQSFFSAMGICILNGYGLTETAPVVGAEIQMAHTKGYLTPLKGTEIKVVDNESGKTLLPGQKGVLKVRGPQVMKGYYKNPEMTASVIDEEGWLNTGDNVVMTWDGKFSIRGRAKDTIVLIGGENIEPVPIEAKLQESEFIETAVVVGQDKKYLGALIVPAIAQIEQYLDSKNIAHKDKNSLLKLSEVRNLLHSQIQSLISQKNGFKAFEHISQFTILENSFEVNKELSVKQELKRSKVNDIYSKEIESLFA
ncbi:MAG: long-chain fatty acid--CoA ligase [Sphaerochaetaceae bacterium]|nr:long-chain fatty acid--CoA ligase [Sphaerochaetaceae bacterium]